MAPWGTWVGTQLIEANSASAHSAYACHPWVLPPRAFPCLGLSAWFGHHPPREGHSPGAEHPWLWAGWRRDPGLPLAVGVDKEGWGGHLDPRNTTLVLPPPQGWGSAGQEQSIRTGHLIGPQEGSRAWAGRREGAEEGQGQDWERGWQAPLDRASVRLGGQRLGGRQLRSEASKRTREGSQQRGPSLCTRDAARGATALRDALGAALGPGGAP